MTSIIFLFELVHLNNLFCDIVEEVDVKGVLKSSLFVVQKATAPKNGVEFRQRSIGAIRNSLATSYDAVRRRATSLKFFFHRQTHKQTHKLTNSQTHKRSHV